MTDTARDSFHRRTGILDRDFALISDLPLFASMNEATLRGLLADTAVQRVARNTVLFLHGEPASRFYVVFDGWVKLFRETLDGHESVIAIFTRGESFAEAAMFLGGNFPASAATVADSRLLVVPTENFLRCLRADTGLAFNMLGSMSRRLHHMVRQIEQLSAKSSTERLASFLIQMCDEATHTCDEAAGPVTVHLPLDKALIAARLGMQPETLSRALAKLREIGVRTKGDEVAIADIDSLRDLSEG